MTRLPKRIYAIVCKHNVWLVGSAVTKDDAKDVDLLVSFRDWPEVAIHIPPDAKPNTFGGFKWKEDNISIDMWPGDLSDLAASYMFKAAHNFKSGVTVIAANRHENSPLICAGVIGIVPCVGDVIRSHSFDIPYTVVAMNEEGRVIAQDRSGANFSLKEIAQVCRARKIIVEERAAQGDYLVNPKVYKWCVVKGHYVIGRK